MRKIVILLVVLLTLTGLLVRFEAAVGLPQSVLRLLSLIHYWGGLGFLVMFPLYAWDHIRHNRHWLTALRAVTFSGALQTAAAVLLMGSGLVIIAYGEQAWQFARDLHHWLTYPLAASVALHFLAPKDWRG